MRVTGEPLAKMEPLGGGLRLWIPRVRNALRSRALILAELAGIALAGVLITALPQRGEEGFATFVGNQPALARFTQAAGLHELLYGPLFLALIALTTVTLSLVLWDQWKRALRLVSAAPEPASFARVPHRRELTVPRGAAGQEGVRISVRGRAGSWGTPLFHLGLLLIVLAGFARAGLGRDAVTDLLEGEPLPAGAPFAAEWGTAFSRGFALPETIRIERLTPAFHASGLTRELEAELRVGEGEAARTTPLAMNAPVDLGPQRLFLTTTHGPAAMLQIARPTGVERNAVLIPATERPGVYEAVTRLGGGVELRTRATMTPERPRPTALQVRAVRDGTLLWVGALKPGQRVDLPGGPAIALEALPLWVQVRGNRDHLMWLAYLGFALVVLGATLMYGVVQIDTLVQVTPGPEGDRVLVAMRPHRFPALYDERFEALVKEHGGT